MYPKNRGSITLLKSALRAVAATGAGLLLVAIATDVSSATAEAKGGQRYAKAYVAGTSRKVLDRSSTGPAVQLLQKKLRVGRDGMYGAATERAVRRFQWKHQLAIDGIAGKETLTALKIRVLCSQHKHRKRRGSGAKGRRVHGARGRGNQRRVRRHSRAARGSWSVPSHLKGRLSRIARCESGGNPRAISPNGQYRGKYQFMRATWLSVGGSGDPASASGREQDFRASLLYNRTGASSWPACGR